MLLQMPLKAAAFYVALHILLLVALIAAVIIRRRQARVGLGDGGDKLLARRIRAHGNAAEQAAPNIAILTLLGLLAAPVYYVHLFGFVSLLARILHAVGLSRTGGPSFGRTLGMVLTTTSFVIGAIGLLVLAIV